MSHAPRKSKRATVSAALDVAVHDAGRMDVVESSGHSGKERRELEDARRIDAWFSSRAVPEALDPICERAAIDVLHHQEVLTTFLPTFDDFDDVGVRESTANPSFTLESNHLIERSRYGRFQKLDRDRTAHGLLVRFVDDAHAAASQRAHESVVAEGDERLPLVGPWSGVNGMADRFSPLTSAGRPARIRRGSRRSPLGLAGVPSRALAGSNPHRMRRSRRGDRRRT